MKPLSASARILKVLTRNIHYDVADMLCGEMPGVCTSGACTVVL